MTDIYIKKITDYFNMHGYGHIETNNDKIYSYITNAQNHMYIINILDINLYPIDHWKFAIKSYEQAIDKHFVDIPADKKFVLNVFIGENTIGEVYDVLKDIPVEYDKKTISINWFVDLVNKQVKIPKDHPKSLLGIQNILNKFMNPSSINDKKDKKALKLVTKARVPSITFSLIAINIICWLILVLAGGSTNSNVLIKYGAAESKLIFGQHQYWRLLTSMFIHIGPMHLLYNLLALYIFGIRTEKYLGHFKFIQLYIISGIMGSFISSLTYLLLGLNILSAGASGAIFGVQGCALILTMDSRRFIDGINSYVIIIMICVGLLFGFTNSGINNIAHIVGLITGIIMTKAFTR